MRDAHRGDAPAIGEIWSAAVPYLVRTAARAAADMREDKTLRRRRWVGLVDGVVAGTATAQQLGEHEVFVTVEVHPDHGSRGVGTALLHGCGRRLPRHRPDAVGEQRRPDLAGVRGAQRVPPRGRAPDLLRGPGGRRGRRAAAERAAPGDPGGAPRPADAARDLQPRRPATTRAGCRGATRCTSCARSGGTTPTTPPACPSGSSTTTRPRPVLAAFTSVQVDRERGRAWSTMTATHPTYRRLGLARWVKRRMLNALDETRRHGGVDRQRLHQRGDARRQRAARLRRGGDVDPAGAPALGLTLARRPLGVAQPSSESTSRNPVALARTARFQVQVSAQSTTPSPRRYAAISYCT